MLIGIFIGIFVGVGIICLMLILKPGESTSGVEYEVGQDVTVVGNITSMDSELGTLPDAPKKIVIKPELGKEYKAYYYCGYTRRIDAVQADKDLKVGDKVEVTGKYKGSNFIDVCNENYSIRKI